MEKDAAVGIRVLCGFPLQLGALWLFFLFYS
jgi:hypothetical protein